MSARSLSILFLTLGLAAAQVSLRARAEQPPLSGGGDPEPPFGVPSADVLRKVSQQQSELALLELAIKKAELQRKLLDLRAGSDPFAHGDAPEPSETVMPPTSVPMPAVSPAAFPPPSSPPVFAHRPVATAANFAIRRIHRVHGQLTAELVCPDGDIKEVSKGSMLSPGLLVADIRVDGVFVRQGQQDLAPLPAAADGR